MQNLEIKCAYPNLRLAERLAVELPASYFGRLIQTDTYFQVKPGRLKLRHICRPPIDENYELIAYRRPNRGSARTSNYQILPMVDGPAALSFLSASFGVRVRVIKARKVFLQDNLRIHLDTVRGLGRFLEFELIVSARHSLRDCRERMRRLMTIFRIEPKSLIRSSYADLIAP
jgi:predicted adenylyl cyclase CyaB